MVDKILDDDTTYLELVRSLGAETMARCGGDCSARLHRAEAAVFLDAFFRRPDLVWALDAVMDRVHGRSL